MRPAVASLAVVALSLAGPLALADQVLLKGGGRVTGIVVERTERRIVIETGPGRLTLPVDRVLEVRDGAPALLAWQERAARLAPDDAAGWLEAGLWADERELRTQARQAFERVLLLDPDNALAHAGLGHLRVAGRWLDADDARRARGEVRFEGRWMSAVEREELLRERAEDRAQDRARSELARIRAESDARVREAEARARAAEARAEQSTGPYLPGPYSYGVGGLVLGGSWWRPHTTPHPGGPHVGAGPPAPAPPPKPRTSSWR